MKNNTQPVENEQKQPADVESVHKNASIAGSQTVEAMLFDNLDGELLRLDDVAVTFGWKTKTIKNWIAKRDFPFVRVGRRTYVQKESLREWLRRKEFKPWE